MKENVNSFKQFVLDQLAPLDGVTCRGMFGGYGVYCRSTFFGIVYEDRLYFKTTEATAAKYRDLGMKPFRPGPNQVMKNYHEVPADILEDARELCDWARESISAAAKAPAKRPRPARGK
ncbi:MAG: TfoX/Sxy family protein [Candidatus Hydrogenedentes bacterium]|nr:TfoX/Sxy family protein [Candidatus Hydrogenedentota bacterium]